MARRSTKGIRRRRGRRQGRLSRRRYRVRRRVFRRAKRRGPALSTRNVGTICPDRILVRLKFRCYTIWGGGIFLNDAMELNSLRPTSVIPDLYVGIGPWRAMYDYCRIISVVHRVQVWQGSDSAPSLLVGVVPYPSGLLAPATNSNTSGRLPSQRNASVIVIPRQAGMYGGRPVSWTRRYYMPRTAGITAVKYKTDNAFSNYIPTGGTFTPPVLYPYENIVVTSIDTGNNISAHVYHTLNAWCELYRANAYMPSVTS